MEFSDEIVEKAALALFVARYDRQPIPESFDDSRHHDCRVFARAVLAAVADDLRREGANAAWEDGYGAATLCECPMGPHIERAHPNPYRDN